MKISEVTREIIKDHCGISGDDSDGLLDVYGEAAKTQICGYTGLSLEELDDFPDLVYAYLAIVGEMFSAREITVESDKINPMAKQIMDLHRVNLL
ncbi:MAG: phage gp6-like head-tail connector protein [Ruminococcaceae bacterium]|nr:phage gp6-like head-tail connector protein [Oscillospiraceae bacterium]